MMDNPTTPDASATADHPHTTSAESAREDWRNAITEPELRRVAAKFTSPRDVVKSYASLQSRLGRSVVKPGPDASAEEVACYRRQLGVPENADGYDLRLPEGLPESLRPDTAGEALQQDFAAAMHEAGASNEVVQKALDWYYGSLGQSLEQQQKMGAERRAEAEAELRQDWGGDHQRNLAFAQRAVQEFGGEELMSLLESQEADGMKLGDHPAVVRTFASIGRRVGEDTPLSGEPLTGENSLQARIDNLHALQDSDPRRYATPGVQDELRQLYGKLYGGQPIVGSEGRRL